MCSDMEQNPTIIRPDAGIARYVHKQEESGLLDIKIFPLDIIIQATSMELI